MKSREEIEEEIRRLKAQKEQLARQNKRTTRMFDFAGKLLKSVKVDGFDPQIFFGTPNK